MQFSWQYAKDFLTTNEMETMQNRVSAAHDELHERKGLGSDFTGWLDLPAKVDAGEYTRIKAAAAKIRQQAEVLIVIGIGGSYLGAKAAIEMLCAPFYNIRKDRSGPQIFFAGHNISSNYLAELKELIADKSFAVNIISKSGTTTEPAIAFRFFKLLLEEKYGKDEARERIYVTTDKSRGALFSLAKEEGYERFVIPDDVGGRYSVLTPVGLLPMAAAGIDTDAVLSGARDAMDAYGERSIEKNDCYAYAAARNILYEKGKTIEVLANYEGSLHDFAEWWKQLYGESEGKDGKGIFPAAVDFSTDLHSMGQYLQDGKRNLFETVIRIKTPRRDMDVPEMAGNIDGLGFLEGKTVDYVNTRAFLGTLLAHTDGGVPCLLLEMEKQDAYHFGRAVYFFEKACGISGYILGVNPFDQPGVEAYKKNMFALLGKPGYAEDGERLSRRLGTM